MRVWAWLGHAFVLVAVGLPLLSVFVGACWEGGWAPWQTVLVERRDVVGRSVGVAALGAAGAVALGLPLAWWIGRWAVPGRRALVTVALLTLLAPPFIGAYAWVLLLGQAGVLRAAGAWAGVELPTIYGPGGVALVYALQYYPFVLLLTLGALRRVDGSLEEAARSLGASPWRAAWRVSVPLVAPSVGAGALMAFLLGLANFGTPMILSGGESPFLATLAYTAFTSEVAQTPGLAGAACGVLVGVSAAVVAAQGWAGRRRRRVGRGAPRRVQPLEGAARWWVPAACWGGVALSAAPLAVVVWTSLRNTHGPVFQPGLGLDSYRQVLHAVPQAIRNSLTYATAAAAAIAGLGAVWGYVSARGRGAAARALDPVLSLPYVVPGVVLGIGWVWISRRLPWDVTGTGLALIAVYVVRRLPYAVRSSAAILSQLDPALEDAARSLGASEAATFGRVTLPLMAPGVASGALLGWVTAVNELSASVVLYVGATATMPIKVYQAVIDGSFGPAAALATLLLGATGVCLYAALGVAEGDAEALAGGG